MKTLKCLFFLLLFAPFLKAQSSNNLYGIVRQNYFSWVTDPIMLGDSFEVFDSATIQLGSLDPSIGFVSNIGSNRINGAVNLTGAALNPYDSTFIFLGYRDVISLDLRTGNTTNRELIYSAVEDSYFDNFRFCNADSSLYGLARTNYISRILDPTFPLDSIDVLDSTSLRLATLNTSTGLISIISASSIGEGFALAGSTIDPFQMVYYYSNGYRLIGVDIYDGSVYSDAHIVNYDGDIFDNFAYSCADTGIYGLVRKNYFSWTYDPTFPGDSFQVFDSATVRLGKINPNTGFVTTVSPSTVCYGGYSLNGGAAVDPNTMTYYFSTGSAIVGVSLITGNKVSEIAYDFEAGQYFDLMRNFQNCMTAVASRLKDESTGIATTTTNAAFEMYPNPTSNQFKIHSEVPIQNISITDVSGRLMKSEKYIDTRTETTLSVSNYASGIYLVTINGVMRQKLFVK